MPIRLCVSHRAAHKVLGTPSAHVWISDDLLQESLQAFVSTRRSPGCKRHGSNVPGPLEARRRSTKRRMGYLGTTGHHGAPPQLDPALTFGWFSDRRGSSVQQQELNWLPPGAVDTTKKSKHTYPDLPAWLDVKRPEPEETTVDLDKILGFSPKVDCFSVEEYKERVKQTKTPQDIRDLHRELGNASLDTWLCSIEGFDHLLARYLTCQEQFGEDNHHAQRCLDFLLEYLEDERIEYSEGQNLKKLLAVLESQGEVSQPQLKILRYHTVDLLQESARDSRGGREDISKVIASLVEVGVRAAKRLSQPSIMLEHFEEVWCIRWNNMRVRRKAVSHIVPYLVELPISSRTVHLAATILHDMPGFVLSKHTKEIGSFVQKIMAADLEQQIPAGSLRTGGSSLSAFLVGCGKERVADFAHVVTLNLARGLTNLKQKSVNLRFLCFWAGELRSVLGSVWHLGLGPDEIKMALDDIAAGSKPADVPFIFHGLEGKGITRMWLRHWLSQAQLAPGLKHKSVDAACKSSLEDTWMHSFAKLERSSGHFLNLNQVAEASLIKAARTHGLDWESLLLDLMNLAKVLNHAADIDAMVRGLKRLDGKSSLTIKHREFLINFINEEGSRDAFSALRTFNADTRLFLSDLPNLIPALLDNAKIDPGRILVLLTKPDRHAQVAPGLRKHDPACGLSDDRIDLIHKVALAMATSDRFTRLQASSSVHYCWKLLKLHQAPMDQRLAKAAVVAGVLKPIAAGEWIPTKQFQWALNVVTSIHGEEAANKIDRMAYSMRPKRTWKLPPRQEKIMHQPPKKHWRDLGGLTPLQRKVVGEGQDVPENKEWLYTKAARDTIGRSGPFDPKGEQQRIWRMRLKSPKTTQKELQKISQDIE